jgi:hypothetical protein
MIENAESQTKEKLYQDLEKFSRKNYSDTLPISTVLHPFIRRRKKEKKKSSSKPAAEGEEQEDVEICLGSGKDDISYLRHSSSVCMFITETSED